MEFLKQCKTCEFNFSGICVGHGDTYKYGEAIINDTLYCDDWSASFDYFSEITKNAPWYIKEPYQDCKIDYQTFEKLLEADAKDEAIDVNIYDAIREIYGLSLVDLAVLLNVTFGVMHRARSMGTPDKRLKNFSQVLCIPINFFQKITTHDFDQLKICKEEFEQRIKYFGNHFWLMFDEGITDKSTHGNVLWHQMRLDFKLRNNGVKQI